MGTIYVIDGDFIDKLAKLDKLELLRIENNKLIVTDKVYEELKEGARRGSPSTKRVIDWLDKNQNEPWLEYKAPTPSPVLTKGHGERSIVDLINERQAIDPSIHYTALSDNSSDVKKITEALDDTSRANVRLLREFTNDLAARNIITPDEYTRLEIKMVNSKVMEKGEEVYKKVFSEPRPEVYSLIPDSPNYGATEIEIVRRKGLTTKGKPNTMLPILKLAT